MKKKIVAALLVGALAMTSAGCALIEKTEGAINREVVAKGSGIKITRGQLEADKNVKVIMDKIIGEYGQNYRTKEEAVKSVILYKSAIIRTMVNQKIVDEKLKEFNIELTDEEMKAEIDKKVEEYIKVVGGEEEYNKNLETAGLTKEAHRNSYEEAIINEKLYDAVTKDVAVKEEDIKTYYEANKENYTEKPNTVKLSYILVDTKEKADEVLNKLKEGGSFEDLAKEYSLDEGTKDKGGDLGDITYSNPKLGSSIMNVIKTLEVNDVKSIEDARGFNVVRVEDKKNYPVKEYDAVKADIEEILEKREKDSLWTEKMTEWTEKIKLKIYDDKLVYPATK